MKSDKDTGPGKSVKSPSDSREGLISNAGGMPETWSVEETFKNNLPPNYPAKNSVETRGSMGKDED